MTFLTPGTTSSDSREWGTPDHLYNPLNEVYDFTLDGAASHENAKAAKYCTNDGTYHLMGPGSHPGEVGADGVRGGPEPGERWPVRISPLDGLEYPWRDERVFLNPPWGESSGGSAGIADFLRKARNESLRNRALVVAIIPARMDTNWMHDFVLPYARVTWKRGRTKFVDPSGQARGAPPVGIGIAVYR